MHAILANSGMDIKRLNSSAVLPVQFFFVSWNLDNEELSRFVLGRRICWNSYLFFYLFRSVSFIMIDIRKDSIYMLILYENDSKVDSVLSILTLEISM